VATPGTLAVGGGAAGAEKSPPAVADVGGLVLAVPCAGANDPPPFRPYGIAEAGLALAPSARAARAAGMIRWWVVMGTSSCGCRSPGAIGSAATVDLSRERAVRSGK
jgi:hypothetical protein